MAHVINPREMAGYYIDGIGMVEPKQFAGVAKLLAGHCRQVIEDPRPVDMTTVGALRLVDSMSPTDDIVVDWKRDAHEALEAEEEPWLPLGAGHEPRGLQILTGVVAADIGDGERTLLKVPPSVRRDALATLADACGGLVPEAQAAPGRFHYRTYLDAHERRCYPESKIDPDRPLTLRYALHDRQLSDHVMGAAGMPPVLTRTLATESASHLDEAAVDESGKQKARKLCPQLDLTTATVTRAILSKNPLPFSPDGLPRLSSVIEPYDGYKNELLLATARRQLAHTMIVMCDPARDFSELPDLHLQETPKEFLPPALGSADSSV